MKRLIGVLLLVLCLVLGLTPALCVPMTAAAAETGSKEVRVGWFESPFNMTDQFGRRSGYAYEYQQEIAAYTGWTYRYVNGTWPELYQMLCDGEIDLLADVSNTGDRKKKMLFPSQPMGIEEYYVFISSETNSGITTENPLSFQGKRVGVNEGSVQKELFQKWAKANGVKAEIVELKVKESRAEDMLNSGEIDAYVSLDAYGGENGMIPVTKIGSSEFYFAVNKSRPDLMEDLESAMGHIQDEDRNLSQRLTSTYLTKSGTSQFLTQREKRWLSSHPDIRVGYNMDYLAFCAEDPETGRLTGALKTFLDLASGCMYNATIDFEPKAFTTTQEALDALEEGRIDCVFPMNISSYDGEMLGVMLTAPMMNSEMYALVRESDGGNFSLDGQMTVAVNRGNPTYEAFLNDHFPDWRCVHYDTIGACLEAIAAGNADCVLLSNYRLSRMEDLIDKYHLTPVTTGVELELSFAVRRQDDSLYSILNKVTNNVPVTAVNASLAAYSVEEQPFSLLEYLWEHILAVAVCVAALMAFIMALMIRSRRAERVARRSERELAKNEKQLQEALEASEQANRAKTIFLSNMSHDMRTPMNAISGFASLAKTHIDDREQVMDDLGKISASSEHLLSLINDVLDMSRIESGRMSLVSEEFSFGEFLSPINAIISGQCQDKGLEYDFRIIGSIGSAYIGDELKLRQVLINILGNSVKFTPSGGQITFSVEQVGLDHGEATLRFIISDTGIGMDKEYIPKIFDAFSQERAGAVNKYGSTGLGMAISRNIVRLMNGDIYVESEKGKGSTFTVTIDITDAGKGVLTDADLLEPDVEEDVPVDEAADAGSGEGLSGHRVLIVEDMMINAELLGDILDMEEIDHEWAENGRLAVERFKKCPEGYYDAILMDIRMPEMTGLEATEAIRKLDHPDAKTVPIIAMSANAFSDDVENSLQAGMNAHLSKPIEIDKLFETLETFFE